MANIKFVEFTPNVSFSGGNKTLYFTDCPGGISFDMDHLNPVSSRRTQDGGLITQTVRYNKKVINLTIGIHDFTIKTYFESLFESGVQITFTIWVENTTTYVEEAEFTGTVQMLSFGESADLSSNSRSLAMTLSEV